MTEEEALGHRRALSVGEPLSPRGRQDGQEVATQRVQQMLRSMHDTALPELTGLCRDGLQVVGAANDSGAVIGAAGGEEDAAAGGTSGRTGGVLGRGRLFGGPSGAMSARSVRGMRKGRNASGTTSVGARPAGSLTPRGGGSISQSTSALGTVHERRDSWSGQQQQQQQQKRSMFRRGRGHELDERDYEAVRDEQIINAPIVDIRVVSDVSEVAEDYYRISKSPMGKRADLNLGAGASQRFLAIRKDPQASALPVVSLAVIFPDRSEFIPAGFNVVRRGAQIANLNQGTSGERVYLCYKRGPGNPITNIGIFFPTKEETVPEDYIPVERTPLNNLADMNSGTNGAVVHVFYRQRLRNLEALRNEYGVLSDSLSSTPSRTRRAVAMGLVPTAHGSMIPMAPVNLHPVPSSNNLNKLRGHNASGSGSGGPGSGGSSPDDDLIGRGGDDHGSSASSSSSSTSPQAQRGASLRNAMLTAQRAEAETTADDDDDGLSFDEGDVSQEQIHQHQQGRAAINRPPADQPPPPPNSSSQNNNLSPRLASPVGKSISGSSKRPQHPQHVRVIHQGEESDSENDTLTDAPSSTADGLESSRGGTSSDAGGLDDESGGGNGKGGRGTGMMDDVESIVSSWETSRGPRFDDIIVTPDGLIAPAGRRKLLLPLLAAIYVRSESVFDMALSGLLALLRETNMFESELTTPCMTGHKTMLDLTVECICDRLDAVLFDEFPRIVTFLRVVVRRSAGMLAHKTVSRLFRGLVFVCSCYATKMAWVRDASDFPFEEGSSEHLPFRVLLELVGSVVGRVEAVPVARDLPRLQASSGSGPITTPLPGSSAAAQSRAVTAALELISPASATGDASPVPPPTSTAGSQAEQGEGSPDPCGHGNPNYAWMREVAVQITMDAVEGVDVAKLTEWGLSAIMRHSSSSTSDSFWTDMTGIARGLFADQNQRNAYLVLAALCKVGSSAIRTGSGGRPVPRDVANKLVALEALVEFVGSTGMRFRSSRVYGYQVRRLLASCILSNSTYALVDRRVYSRLLQLVTMLWVHYRVYLKLELGVLTEHLVITVLRATPQQVQPHLQTVLARQLTTWVQIPHSIVELFINYDMDRAGAVAHWTLLEQLCAAITGLAERLAWPIEEDLEDQEERIRQSQRTALDTAALLAKTLMDAAGHANLIVSNSSDRGGSNGDGDSEEVGAAASVSGAGGGSSWSGGSGNGALLSRKASSSPRKRGLLRSRSSGEDGDDGDDGLGLGGRSGSGLGGHMPFVRRQRSQSMAQKKVQLDQREALLAQAVKLASDKSLMKAIKFLIAQGYMADTPMDVVNFLRVQGDQFDDAEIGDVLSQEGRNGEVEFWESVRYRFIRAMSFVEMSLEDAMRQFLTNGGFRLPGEAQKIDRLIECFAKCFWDDNAGTVYCPFVSPDTPFVVAYALIILNTDHHRANLDHKKKNRRMTQETFRNNLRGVDNGNDIDPEYLNKMFDSISSNGIELPFQDPAALARGGQSGSGGGGGGSGGGGGGSGSAGAHEGETGRQRFIRETSAALSRSEELLRSTSTVPSRFMLAGIDQSISVEVVNFMFETVWVHFHGMVDALLGSMLVDSECLCRCLDVLRDMISICVFLELPTERAAFATQLARFKFSREHSDDRQNISSYIVMGRHKEEEWFQALDQSSVESAVDTIQGLHDMMAQMKELVDQNERRKQLEAVAARIGKKARLLEGNREFLHEGELVKRSRSGRCTSYRFFLFSDQLLYAHQRIRGGEYKVHEQMLLSVMKVMEARDDADVAFFIQHPKKSFVVYAANADEKQVWVQALQNAISNSTQRRRLKRRISLLGRLHEQAEFEERLRQEYLRTGVALPSLSSTSVVAAGSTVGGSQQQQQQQRQHRTGVHAVSRAPASQTFTASAAVCAAAASAAAASASAAAAASQAQAQAQAHQSPNGPGGPNSDRGTPLSPTAATATAAGGSGHGGESPLPPAADDTGSHSSSSGGSSEEHKETKQSSRRSPRRGKGATPPPRRDSPRTNDSESPASVRSGGSGNSDGSGRQGLKKRSSTVDPALVPPPPADSLDKGGAAAANVDTTEPATPPSPGVGDDDADTAASQAATQMRVEIRGLTDRELTKLFLKGLRYWMSMLDPPNGRTGDKPQNEIDDETKLCLYGLYKQAKQGNYAMTPAEEAQYDSNTEEGRVALAKLHAWQQNRGMSKADAKTEFLVTLTRLVSDWRSSC